MASTHTLLTNMSTLTLRAPAATEKNGRQTHGHTHTHTHTDNQTEYNRMYAGEGESQLLSGGILEEEVFILIMYVHLQSVPALTRSYYSYIGEPAGCL